MGPHFLVRRLRGLHSERLGELPKVTQPVKGTRMPEFNPGSSQGLPSHHSVLSDFHGDLGRPPGGSDTGAEPQRMETS